jgi:hypothetical protein
VLAHLIADYGGLSKQIDIPVLWGDKGDMLRRGDMQFKSVVDRWPYYFSKELIKAPEMSFFADQVIEAFPAAKRVHIVRDPRDNIRSELNVLFIPGNLDDLDGQHRPTDPLYRDFLISDTWGVNENYIGTLAHKWNLAADCYLENADKIVSIRYEDFCKDKLKSIRDIAQRLGVSEQCDISDRVDIQYQPRGNRRISWNDFFGAKNLDRIEQICGRRMAEFGYSVSLK